MDMIRKENVEDEIQAVLALIDHVKDLLGVWGRGNYWRNLYPLDAFENKDWKEMIELLHECCEKTLEVDTDFHRGFSQDRSKEHSAAVLPK